MTIIEWCASYKSNGKTIGGSDLRPATAVYRPIDTATAKKSPVFRVYLSVDLLFREITNLYLKPSVKKRSHQSSF